MNILVIGGGGREHALAWKIAQSPKIQLVYVAPGNGGTAHRLRACRTCPLPTWWSCASGPRPTRSRLTVVGPEVPLGCGRGGRIPRPRHAHFWPHQGRRPVGKLQGIFSKAFMRRHSIPTAEYATFSDPVAAHAYVDKMGAPTVVKADGLAAGKGVVVAMTVAEAHEAIDFMLVDNTLGVVHNEGADGQAVPRVVIEEFLEGEEASFIVMVDGKNVLPLATSQDHKRLLDADAGAEHGRHGRVFARARWSPPMCMPKPCAKSSCPPSKAWRKTAFRSAASCTRAS